MTTKVFEPTDVVPEVPRGLASRINETAKTIVFWTIMGVGFVFPLVGAAVGLFLYHH